jgi:hypothetical protein
MSDKKVEVEEDIFNSKLLGLTEQEIKNMLFGDLSNLLDEWLGSEMGSYRIIRSDNYIISCNFKEKNNLFYFYYDKNKKPLVGYDSFSKTEYNVFNENVDIIYNKFLEIIDDVSFVSDIESKYIVYAHVVDYDDSIRELIKKHETIKIEDISLQEFFDQRDIVKDVYLFELECAKLVKDLEYSISDCGVKWGNLESVYNILTKMKQTQFWDKLKNYQIMGKLEK